LKLVVSFVFPFVLTVGLPFFVAPLLGHHPFISRPAIAY